MKYLALTFLSAFVIATNAMAADPTNASLADAKAIMQTFQQRAANSKTVYMEFTQERVLKMFNDPLVTEGVMLIAQPDHIRWETTDPYQTIVIGEKKSVVQFEYNNGKWDKLNLGFPQAMQRMMQQMSAMNRGKMDAMMEDFNITATTGSETVLKLVPKMDMVKNIIASMEIHLSPDLSATRQVVMNEPNGDLTRINFHAEKYNVDFPAGTFDQSKPVPIAEIKSAVNHAP
jgi:outer membrane lipoprotein-sorting protein